MDSPQVFRNFALGVRSVPAMVRTPSKALIFFLLGAVLLLDSCKVEGPGAATPGPLRVSVEDAMSRRLVEAAMARLKFQVRYDPAYVDIPYPLGDVPADTGVCSDEVIRVYRALGLDLQALVHEDMRRAFTSYPKIWGLKRPDANIDHRRVPNLETFFRRHGAALPVSARGLDYRPGDLVTWMLEGRLPHIGIVTDLLSRDGDRPLIVHNIGWGPELSDMLFDYPVTGHFRYKGPA